MIRTDTLKVFSRAVFLPLVLVVTLQGCVSENTQWEHPSIARADWDVDAAQCKWEAKQKADRDYRDRAALTQQRSYKNTQSIDAMFAASDINKTAITLFSRCMADLGYVEAADDQGNP